MQAIPAIDLKEGLCVRLRRGDMQQATIYSNDPVEQAGIWVNLGAQRIHIVDLDGAIAGEPKNLAVIQKIIQTYPNVEIEIGGGIRDLDTINRYIDAGVNYIVLGTKVIQNPDFLITTSTLFPQKIIVGLDANQANQVATEGWLKMEKASLHELATEFAKQNIAGIIYTDISRDGMLSSPNIAEIDKLCRQVPVPIIASGGVGSVHDLQQLRELDNTNLFGVIIGRALYDNKFSLAEAQKTLNA